MPERESSVEEVADIEHYVQTQLARALTSLFENLKEALKTTSSTELIKSISDDIRFAKVAISFSAVNSYILRREICVLFVINIMGSLIHLVRHFYFLILLSTTV